MRAEAPGTAGGLRRRPRLAILSAAAALFGAAVVGMGAGAVQIPATDVLSWALFRLGLAIPPADPMVDAVLTQVRAPRVLMGALAGAGLAAAGVLMQAFFRNPLADPALIGVSTGGALGAVAVIVLGAGPLAGLVAALGPESLAAAAFLGSLGTTLVVYTLARRDGMVDVTTMLLAGIAVNAIAGAGIGLLTFLATDTQLRSLTFWTLGSLSAAGWPALVSVVLPVAAVLAAIPLLSRPLNALLLGDAEALHLGVPVETVKRLLLVLTSVAAGAVVAAIGVVGFVGLIAPHFARLLVGPDHRVMLPLAVVLGALLLLVADTAARTLVVPAELPLGVLTALAGGPLFLWLLRRSRGVAFRA